jgi:Cys-rich repeat protein
MGDKVGQAMPKAEDKGTGKLEVLVSDAPADIGDFDSVEVHFSRVRIFKGQKPLDFEIDESVDLTQVLEDQAKQILEEHLEAGVYHKIELHVDSVEAKVNDSEAVVSVPSNKLMITKNFEVIAEETTEFVFDINVVRKGHELEYNLLPVISESGVVGEDIDEPNEIGCTDDADCAEGEFCDSGECEEQEEEEDECTEDADCDEGFMCSDGECVEVEEPECAEDADCAENETCSEGECVELEEPECVEDADCAENETCSEGECVEAEQPECTEDADCDEGYICSEGTCLEQIEQPECTEDANCSVNESCVNNTCVAA